jgi:hypothetical protein
MNKSLDEIKESISSRYLGKVGIHAVNIQPKTNSLYIYFDSKSNQQQKDVLEKIRKEIEPYFLVAVKEERAGFI